jgi:hypothetical protein
MKTPATPSPIRYVYCLVDAPKNRFKIGSTLDELYALALAEFYCEQRSFQVGYVEAYGHTIVQVVTSAYAGLVVDRGEHDEHGVWLDLQCFEAVRLALLAMDHAAAPANLTWMAAEKERIRIVAQLNKLLGIEP